MTAIDVAIICLMTMGLVIYVGEPLVRRVSSRPHGREGDDATERLLLQKEMLYVAIRDLDFDFQTGKVDQKDHAELRQQLEREAVQILRQLNAVDPLVTFDNEVEQQVIVLRRRRPSTTTYGSGRAMCPRCRTYLENDENFCPSCGQELRPS